MSLPRLNVSTFAYVTALTAPLAGALIYAATLEPARGPGVPVPVPVMVEAPAEAACESPEPEIRHISPPVAPADGPGALLPLIPGDKVVLADGGDRGWGEGKVRWAREQAVELSAARGVDEARLPAELSVLLGADVHIYGPNGKVCEARLEREAELLTRYNGDGYEYLDTDDDWAAVYERGEMPRGIPAKLFRDRDPVVTARFVPMPGESCAGGVWARAAELAAPTVLVEVVPDRAEAEALEGARRQIRRSELYRAIEAAYAEYAEQTPDVPSWKRFIRGHFHTSLWRDVDGRFEMVHLRLGEFESSCGDGFWWNSAEVRPLDDPWTDPEGSLGWGQHVAAMVDADGDGQVEVIFDGDLGPRIESASADLAMDVSEPWEGCPC